MLITIVTEDHILVDTNNFNNFSFEIDDEDKIINIECDADHEKMFMTLYEDDIFQLETCIQNFKKCEVEQKTDKTITKPLINFTVDEIYNICMHHPLCQNCPLGKLTGGIQNCARSLIQKEISVKESDLKDG